MCKSNQFLLHFYKYLACWQCFRLLFMFQAHKVNDNTWAAHGRDCRSWVVGGGGAQWLLKPHGDIAGVGAVGLSTR